MNNYTLFFLLSTALWPCFIISSQDQESLVGSNGEESISSIGDDSSSDEDLLSAFLALYSSGAFQETLEANESRWGELIGLINQNSSRQRPIVLSYSHQESAITQQNSPHERTEIPQDDLEELIRDLSAQFSTADTDNDPLFN